MTDAPGRSSGLDRRGFIQLAAAGAGMSGAVNAAFAARSETSGALSLQPSPNFADDLNTAEVFVDVDEEPAKPDELWA
jgi:Rieske Fe-S protein